MVNIKINNRDYQVQEGITILEAASQAGIKIPTLCFLKDINEIGACRVCIVELKGKDTLVASCNTKVTEGMDILTNSPKVRQARRMNVEFILAKHNTNCTSCTRSGNCALQEVSNTLNIGKLPFKRDYEKKDWDRSFPLIRNASKCIKCVRCVQICDKVQGLSIWDIVNTGKRTSVDVYNNKKITEAECALCGQCITHCPTGALHERDDVEKLMAAISDPDKIVVVQIAPAVRAAWGEGLGLSRELATEKRMVAAVRALGVDYVFDTNFSADLTIMEELEEEEFDAPLGIGSGAGVIFGATGGVMEAALRTAYALLEGHNPDPDAFAFIRGQDGIRKAELEMGGMKVRAAIVSGLGNARKLIENTRAGKEEYDFVEVMACPGGCVGGGGQPIHDGQELAAERAQSLYCLDRKNALRFSHENPAVIAAYESYFEKPLSHKSHALLHTDHDAWKMPNQL